LRPRGRDAFEEFQAKLGGTRAAFAAPDEERPRESLITNHDVQHDQMQTNLVFERVNLEVWKRTCLLERGQVKHDLKRWFATTMSGIRVPNALMNRSTDNANQVAGVPSILIEESRERRWAFIGCQFRARIASGVEETCDQGLVTAALVMGCEEGLGGVE
jgi:hypothetical protein